MSTDPVQIRREIEATRDNLSSDVDALAYKVSPGRIVEDRKQRVRTTLRNVRDTVMGTASDLGHQTSHGAHAAGDRAAATASAVGDAAHSAASAVGDAAHRAPQAVRRRSEGNPLAAGLIAFGVGMLVSSLIPPTQREQQLAAQARDKAGERGSAVTDKLSRVASEMKEELREPAQQAAESVKATAQDAAQAVTDDTRSAAHDLKDQAQHSRDQVRP
ncbi:DUF3618 domain-containing protein [Verrucosispora sp. WMMA2121]|uniref:DUF3618 domain-containing protein n=1 Tax=Verrucosispora sp. WMMA2121 TaxID=3015164 RepID=UPI0022B70B99|nr:DUF3618 domain-containing protein [Verrucosispora sp. WMMA2121]MCZ7418509.1 DUF3618 domain-containing protein [Verrucosispora sp. WMMA2121]